MGLCRIKKMCHLSLLVFLLVVFSCSVKVKEEAGISLKYDSSQKTQLNFVGHWMKEGERCKLVKGVANEFEFINQNVRVNLKFPEELYNADDSLEIKFIIDQVHKPVADWDILRIKEHYYPIAGILHDPAWGEKYLVDFSQVPEFVNLHKSFINSPAIKERSGNILTGPYNEGFYWAIFANTDVAKKIGIEVKQYDMTYEDLLSYVKAVYDYNRAHNTHIAAIFEDKNWISTEAMFKRLCYSDLDGYDEIVGRVLTPKKIAAIEKTYRACEELSKYKPIILSRMKINWGNDNDYPLKDSCLFFVNGSWMYNIWTKDDKVKIRKMIPCELPVFKPSDSYIGGYTSNWAVPKNAPHLKEAIKMILYWSRPEVAEQWARITKCPSGVKGNLTTSSFGFDAYENFLYTIENKYGGKKIHPVPNNYLYGDRNFNLPVRVIEVLEGHMTADQAIREFRQNAKF